VVSSFLGGFGGASLGSAVLKLSTDARGYRKGLDKAEGDAKRFGKRSAVAIGVGAAGFSLIAGAATLSIRSFAKAGDEVQKMALRTGFSTEALSELRHAADLSGSSLAGFETGVRRMQRTVFDASSGLAEAERSLEELGLTAEELQRLSPEEQFNRIAGALANVEDDSRKAALAQIVFGRSGTALLPMLAQGAEGLAAMREEARDLGIVFDQEAADKAAEFNDAITRLQASGQAFGQEFAGAVVPALTVGIDALTGLTTGFSALPGPVQSAVVALGGLSTVVPVLALGLMKVGPAARTAAAGVRAFSLAVVTSPVGLAALAASLLIGIGLYNRYRQAAADAAEQEERASRIRLNAAEMASDATRQSIDDVERHIEDLEAQVEAMGAIPHASARNTQAAQRERAEYQKLADEIAHWSRNLDDLRAVQRLQNESAEEAAAAQAEQEAAMRAAADAAREQAAALRELSSAAMASFLAMNLLQQNLDPTEFDQAFDAALDQLRPVVQQESQAEALAEELLRNLLPPTEQAGDAVEEFGSKTSDVADEAELLAERMKELEEATRIAIEAERARAAELHSRAVSNAHALARAAQQGANAGIDVRNIGAALAEQGALAAAAAADLAALNPDDPQFQPTAALTQNFYGPVDQRNTKDMASEADPAELLT